MKPGTEQNQYGARACFSCSVLMFIKGCDHCTISFIVLFIINEG